MLTVSALTRLHITVSFELRDCECIALQRPSGAGKSLLLRAIADLDPNEGTVKLDGTLRETVRAPLWRKQVTYLAAEPGWWADTVQSILPPGTMPCRLSRDWDYRPAAEPGLSEDYPPERSNGWGLRGG
jgi:ABC-type iron transport system FetAB ATPase subunit